MNMWIIVTWKQWNYKMPSFRYLPSGPCCPYCQGAAAVQGILRIRRGKIGGLNREKEKLRKDAKKADVVAHKPGLVEKQINNSFNKFAEDIQDLSKWLDYQQ